MAKRGEKARLPAAPPAPTPEQAERIERAKKRNAERGPRLAVTIVPGAPSDMNIAGSHSDHPGWTAHMLDACGTTSTEFAAYLLGSIELALRDPGGEPSPRRLAAAMAAMDGIAPENEAEAMLAAQMLSTHALSAAMLARAQQSGTGEGAAHFIGLATKLSRTYVMQVEALAKLRRGGEQVIRHVHVNEGGQAIVGTVNNYGRERPEGGGRNETLAQPHAPLLEHATVAPMWSADEERIAVSRAGCERQEKVPDARRRGRKRRSEGAC